MTEHVYLNISPSFKFKISRSFRDIKVKEAVCAFMFGRIYCQCKIVATLNYVFRKLIFYNEK